MKMSYYYFNRKEILQKAKERYSKEKTAEYYYLENKEAIRKMSRDRYKTFQKKKKTRLKEYQRKRYQELILYKIEALQNK